MRRPNFSSVKVLFILFYFILAETLIFQKGHKQLTLTLTSLRFTQRDIKNFKRGSERMSDPS